MGLNLGIFAATAAIAAGGSDTEFGAKAKGLETVTLQRMRETGFVNAHVGETDTGPGEVKMSRAWVDALPNASGDQDWKCLSEALYFEARGETVKGQFAVAEVILNRVESERFPETACGVINQGTGKRYQCQFTYTCDGQNEVIHEPRAFDRVAKVARIALDGAVPEMTGGATHYHTKRVRPNWSKVYTKTTSIGTHVFYRHTWKTASK
ncbi:MAG: cell wall hydrolase [Pseudomonadota bacterium]